jgi:hypothetical protein
VSSNGRYLPIFKLRLRTIMQKSNTPFEIEPQFYAARFADLTPTG